MLVTLGFKGLNSSNSLSEGWFHMTLSSCVSVTHPQMVLKKGIFIIDLAFIAIDLVSLTSWC